jgi:hypothetical protein
MQTQVPHRCDSGFALLFVFLLAAAIAISLYMEMPRMVFESQRELEATLIDRGEQYRRAIQLYYRKTGTYPPSLDALENTNGMRFLRRRYPDPMTGKDDWRLVHIGPGGVLTDSLVTKPPGQQKSEQTVSTFITELPQVGAMAATPSGTVPRAMMRRPSEVGPQGAPAAPMLTTEPEVQGNTTEPRYPPAGAPPQPTPEQPGASAVSVGPAPFIPPVPVPGTPAPYGIQPGAAAQAMAPFVSAPANQPGQQAPGGGQPSPEQNPGIRLIQQILTSPAPPGVPPTLSGRSGQQIGGIAGVASKFEGSSIKVYNDRSKYNEWEFIYDFRLDNRTLPPGQTPVPGAQPQSTISGGGGQPSAPAFQVPLPTGSAPGGKP